MTYYVIPPQPQPARSQRNYGTLGSSQQPAPAPAPANRGNTAGSSSHGQGEEHETRPPPTYAEAVRGDHKIQNDD